MICKVKYRNRGWLSVFACVTLWHMSIYSRHIFTYIQQAAILLLWNIAACVLIYRNVSHQGSFKNGVVSALMLRKTIDFTGFSGTFQDIAVADEKYLYHNLLSLYMSL